MIKFTQKLLGDEANTEMPKAAAPSNGHLRVATKASQHPLGCPALKYPTSEIKSRCLQPGTQNVFDSINYIFNLFNKSFIWVLLRFKVKSLPKTKLEALRKSRAVLYIKKKYSSLFDITEVNN